MRVTWAEVKGFIGDKIGEGTFARVYNIPGFSLPDAPEPLVLKRYISARPGTANLDNVAKVRDAPNMTPRQQERLDQMSTWPVRIVTSPKDPAKSVGVVMRRIPERFYFEFRGFEETGPLQRALKFAIQDDELASRIGIRPLDYGQRIRLVGRLALVLASLHDREIVYGDLSLNNVVYDDVSADVMLVDCDSALPAGDVSPFDGKQPHTDGFVPPESAHHEVLRKKRRREGADPLELARLWKSWARQTLATDVYKFALVVVRTFDYGANRNYNRDPASAASKLPREIGDLLRTSLSEVEGSRPSMADWHEALTPDSKPKKKRRDDPAQPEWATGFRQDSSGKWIKT